MFCSTPKDGSERNSGWWSGRSVYAIPRTGDRRRRSSGVRDAPRRLRVRRRRSADLRHAACGDGALTSRVAVDGDLACVGAGRNRAARDDDAMPIADDGVSAAVERRARGGRHALRTAGSVSLARHRLRDRTHGPLRPARRGDRRGRRERQERRIRDRRSAQPRLRPHGQTIRSQLLALIRTGHTDVVGSALRVGFTPTAASHGSSRSRRAGQRRRVARVRATSLRLRVRRARDARARRDVALGRARMARAVHVVDAATTGVRAHVAPRGGWRLAVGSVIACDARMVRDPARRLVRAAVGVREAFHAEQRRRIADRSCALTVSDADVAVGARVVLALHAARGEREEGDRRDRSGRDARDAVRDVRRRDRERSGDGAEVPGDAEAPDLLGAHACSARSPPSRSATASNRRTTTPNASVAGS